MLQVYEAALRDAARGDGISEKERALLGRLRDSLGIAPDDAAALERDMAAGRSVEEFRSSGAAT